MEQGQTKRRTREQETALIKEWEAKPWLPYVKPTAENKWQPDNSAYWEHYNMIRDAYWRRRMLSLTDEEREKGIVAP